MDHTFEEIKIPAEYIEKIVKKAIEQFINQPC